MEFSDWTAAAGGMESSAIMAPSSDDDLASHASSGHSNRMLNAVVHLAPIAGSTFIGG